MAKLRAGLRNDELSRKDDRVMNTQHTVLNVQPRIGTVVVMTVLLAGLMPNARAQRDPGINQPGARGNVRRDPGINQPGARGNVGRDPGINQPGVRGNVGRDPGINQPGVAGNRGVGGSARQARAIADPGINQPGVRGNVGRDPGINQPGAVGNRRR
jgi:hypothetical protein